MSIECAITALRKEIMRLTKAVERLEKRMIPRRRRKPAARKASSLTDASPMRRPLPADPEATTLLDLPISELDLSVRASHALFNLEVETLRELIQFTKDDLLKQRNFGKTSLREIETKLDLFGLRLRTLGGPVFPCADGESAQGKGVTASENEGGQK